MKHLTFILTYDVSSIFNVIKILFNQRQQHTMNKDLLVCAIICLNTYLTNNTQKKKSISTLVQT